MRLFGFGGDNDAAQARNEASQASIQAGGLPLNAIDRLKEAAREDFFTSNLSASELLLTRERGYRPQGQVMGVSVYNVGWQWTPGSSWFAASQEMETLTAAHYHARHLALGRLSQEARLLGADGVVGVRLERQGFEWGTGLLEFMALGTAVRRAGAPPTQGEPFVSALSGADHWALREAGYRPVGFALGNCTWYQVASPQTQQAQTGGWFGGSWQNQELADYTQAVYTAREWAMRRMRAEAEAVGAEGIVGVTLEPHIEIRHVEQGENRPSRHDLVVTFTAFGTSVVQEAAPAPTKAPLTVVRLR